MKVVKTVRKAKELKDYFIDKVETKLEFEDTSEMGVHWNSEQSIYFTAKTEGEGNEVISRDFYIKPCSISCGVRQLSELPNNHEMKQFGDFIKKGQSYNFTKALMKEVIAKAKTVNAAYVLVSNNKNSRNSKINKIMSGLASVQTPFKKNPNSGNYIKVWIC